MLPAGEPVSGCPLTLLPGTSAHEEVQPRSARRLLCRGRQLGQGSGRCPARLAPHCLAGSRRSCLYPGVRGARSPVLNPVKDCPALTFVGHPLTSLRPASYAHLSDNHTATHAPTPTLPLPNITLPRGTTH